MIHISKQATRNYLEALYIAEQYYGKGLAQTLMEAGLAWCDPSLPTELEVVDYNNRAIRFYEKYGFEIEPNSEHYFKDVMPVVYMKRKAEEQS